MIFVFILFVDTRVLGEDLEISTFGGDTQEFFFDVDEIKFKKPKLLKPEFHGFLSLEAPFSEGKDETEKDSSNIFKQTELTFWFGTQILKNLSFNSE